MVLQKANREGKKMKTKESLKFADINIYKVG